MLTPAQQKIRQELEELQVKGLLLPKQQPSPPRARRHRKSWPLYLIGILLLSIICSVNYIKSFKQQHEMMADYLIKVQAYNAKSIDLLKGSMDNSGTQEDLNQAITEQNQLLQNTIKLAAPKTFHEHHQDFIEVMKLREIILTSHVRTKKATSLELNVKQELAKDSFSRALVKEKIRYRTLEDGTIQFWIQAKSYQY
jgi:hypothetical protein